MTVRTLDTYYDHWPTGDEITSDLKLVNDDLNGLVLNWHRVKAGDREWVLRIRYNKKETNGRTNKPLR